MLGDSSFFDNISWISFTEGESKLSLSLPKSCPSPFTFAGYVIFLTYQNTLFQGEVYSNCSCVAATEAGPPFNLSNLAATASSGLCPDEQCSSGWQFIVFCFLNFLIIFFTFFNEAAALQVSLRCVPFNRRSFAIGVQVSNNC